MGADLYQVLGLTLLATSEEIKRQFKKLAIKYHPDKTDDAKHHEIFLQVNKAYETLRDSTTRSQYDKEIGVGKYAPTLNYSSAHPGMYRSQHSYSYYTPGTSYTSGSTGTGTYFGYYQLQTRTQQDAAESLRETQRRAKQDQEREAKAAALVAQKKMREEMERRQQEYIREKKRLREEEERRQREQDARNRLEEELRAQKEMQKQREYAAQAQENEYQRFKREAHLRQWQLAPQNDFGKEEDPIVVETEEEDAALDEEFASFPDQTEEYQTPQQEYSPERKSRSGSEPEVVELLSPEPSAYEDRSPEQVGSPKRPNDQQVPNDSNNFKSKKPRIDMSDLRLTLGASLEDVDFTDMKDLLPSAPGKTRKASLAMNKNPHKRQKFTEFTDGTSKAETLYTPINKQASRQNVSITASDLSPTDFDENRLLFLVSPPTITVSDSMTREEWDAYGQKINSYERKFAEYRKAVFEYQAIRLQKDETHHNVIYSDTTCLDAYQTCLFNDLLLMQNYERALTDFKNTLKSFKKNCEIFQAMSW